MDVVYKEVWIEKGSDISSVRWSLAPGEVLKNSLEEEKIHLKSYLVKLDMLSQKNDRTLRGTVSSGIIGGIALGPLGAVAGALWGARKTQKASYMVNYLMEKFLLENVKMIHFQY